MDVDFLVGIDVGTSGAKAVVCSLDGKVMGQGYHEYECSYPKPSWVEQDVDLIVSKSMEACKESIERAGIDPNRVAAVSFSTQRCCSIFVDKKGEIVRPMISWQDQRSVKELELIREKISAEDFYGISNIPLNTIWMISKILWVQRNEPESYSRVEKVVQLQDYTLKAWGSQDYYDDYSDAVFYGLWDPVAFQWSDELLSVIGLKEDQLPFPVASGTKVGTVSAVAAGRSGLVEGTPLCVGAGDQNAAAVGAGVIDTGVLSVSLGTAGAVAVFSNQPYKDPACMTMVTNHAIEGKWQIEGHQAAAAGVFRWFRDEIAVLEKTMAQTENTDAYDMLNSMVSQVPAGSRGLVVLPYFASAASPRWNSQARGVVGGLTFAHDRRCLARAFMEGITLDVKDILNALIKAGVHVADVRILGGPTKSDVWNQMQSDVYDIPVRTPISSDAAPLGAAVLAGAGVGAFSDIREGCERIVKIGRSYEPVKENAEVYARMYGVYCRMYEGLDSSGAFAMLAQVQDELS